MQQLNYNLTVHNPFRPVEGLMIDIKVYLQYLSIDIISKFSQFNPYTFRQGMFLWKIQKS